MANLVSCKTVRAVEETDIQKEYNRKTCDLVVGVVCLLVLCYYYKQLICSGL